MSISRSATATSRSSASATASLSPARVKTLRLWDGSLVRSRRCAPGTDSSARGEAVDDLQPAALGDVGNRFDERHARIVAQAGPAGRPTADGRAAAAGELPGPVRRLTVGSIDYRGRRCPGHRPRQRRASCATPTSSALWTAETVSQLGTQVSALAIPFVAIEILQATTFEVALLNVVDFLPFLLIGLPAGVWVDRLRRRPVMIAGDLGRAARPGDHPARLPARRPDGRPALRRRLRRRRPDRLLRRRLPELPARPLVARDQLQEGNAKLEISRAAAQVVGPGLAGVLIGILRAPIAVALDAALVPRIGALPLPDPAAGSRPGGPPRGGPAGARDAPRDGRGAALRPGPRVPARTSRPAPRPRTCSARWAARSSSSSSSASWG